MLGTTLESVKQRFGRMGLEVSWHGTGQVLLPSDVLDAFLLALAECLENVRRHSGVTEAHVTITDDETTVRAMVTDAGVGFDLDDVDAARLGFKESVVGRLQGGRRQRPPVLVAGLGHDGRAGGAAMSYSAPRRTPSASSLGRGSATGTGCHPPGAPRCRAPHRASLGTAFIGIGAAVVVVAAVRLRLRPLPRPVATAIPTPRPRSPPGPCSPLSRSRRSSRRASGRPAARLDVRDLPRGARRRGRPRPRRDLGAARHRPQRHRCGLRPAWRCSSSSPCAAARDILIADAVLAVALGSAMLAELEPGRRRPRRRRSRPSPSPCCPAMIGVVVVRGFRRMVQVELDRVLVQSTVSAPRFAVGMLASEELARLDLAAEELLDSVATGKTGCRSNPRPPRARPRSRPSCACTSSRDDARPGSTTPSPSRSCSASRSPSSTRAASRACSTRQQRDGLLSTVWLLVGEPPRARRRRTVQIAVGPVDRLGGRSRGPQARHPDRDHDDRGATKSCRPGDVGSHPPGRAVH